MVSLNDEEITPIKEVKKLVRIAGSTLSDIVKKASEEKSYMPPVKQGKNEAIFSRLKKRP